jgi:hypothetical protein
MALTQFDCPHCSGVFQAENPPAGQAVTCPRCGKPVKLPDELPPPAPDSDPPWAIGELPAGERSEIAAEPTAPFIPFDFRGDVPGSARGRRPPKKRAVVRTLSPQEKKRSRRVRSVVLMISGLVVLAIAVVVLSRF